MKMQTIEPSLLDNMTWGELFNEGYVLNNLNILPPHISMNFSSGYQVHIAYSIPYSVITELAPMTRVQDFHQVSWLSEILVHRFTKNVSLLSGISYETLIPSLSISSIKVHKVESNLSQGNHLNFKFTFKLPEIFMIPVSKAVETLRPLISAIETFDKSNNKYSLFDKPFTPVKKVDLLAEWFRTS